MHKTQILTIMFLIMLSIFTLTSLHANACSTEYTYSSTISPATTDAGLDHVSYIITFTDTGISSMGSGTITIPTGYTSVSMISETASGGQTWTGSITSTIMSFSATSSSGKITTDQTVKVAFTATNPSSAGSYTWKTSAYSNIGQSGTTFAADPATVTVNSAPTVSLSPSTWTMSMGQSKILTVTGSGGTGIYTNYQWYVNGVLAQSGATSAMTFTPESSGAYSISVTVTDSLGETSIASSASAMMVNQLEVAVTQTENGQITPGTSPVNYGDSPTFTITPDSGYNIASITANGVSVPVTSPDGQTYQFNSVSVDSTLTATFAVNTYDLTVNVGADGTSNIASQTVNWGSMENFAFTPDTGYSVADVMVNGTIDDGPVTSLSLTITGDTTVDVNFAINTYTITVTQGANGNIAPDTTVVNYGDSQTFSITPANEYHIVDVQVGGVSEGAVASYTFNDVTADSSITASFAINTYTITVTQSANGVINPGTSTVNYGDTPTFAIAPNGNYHISSITADGVAVAVNSPSGQNYQFSSISSDGSLTATFAINSGAQSSTQTSKTASTTTPIPTVKPTTTATPTQTQDPTATPHTTPSPTPLYVVLVAVVIFAAIIILLLLMLVVRHLKRKVNKALPNPQTPL